MANPFYQINPTADIISEIRLRRIDREKEFLICRSALLEHRHNVLLYGRRGVGKTFLLRLLEQEIIESDNTVFVFEINVMGLIGCGENDIFASFARGVLLQLCASLWTKLLGKSYLDLRQRLDETGQEINTRPKDEITIQRVFSHLMRLERIAKATTFNSVGFSIGAKGEKKEQISLEGRYSQVLSFEFAEFAEELISKVLIPNKKKKIIVLCDDANHMPFYKQEQILAQNISMFSSKKLQFMFVAGLRTWEENTYLPSCFETRVELKGFAKEHIFKLIEGAVARGQNTSLQLTSDTVDLLFDLYSGNPRLTLHACQSAYEFAKHEADPKLTIANILRVFRDDEERQRNFPDSEN